MVAIAIVVLGAGATAAIVATGGKKAPPPQPLKPLAPTGLTANAKPYEVNLTWAEPAGGAKVKFFEIYRDGVRIQTQPASVLTYSDKEARPGETHTYSVDAFSGPGRSRRVTVSVDTPVPPVAAARVEDLFNVHLHTVSATGFIHFGSSSTAGWTFSPTCTIGPCSVKWMDETFSKSSHPLQGLLKRHGGRYTGSATGDQNISCHGTVLQSTVSVTFHVTKAEVSSGVWEATVLVGRVTVYTPAGLGCVSTRAVENLTADLVSP